MLSALLQSPFSALNGSSTILSSAAFACVWCVAEGMGRSSQEVGEFWMPGSCGVSRFCCTDPHRSALLQGFAFLEPLKEDDESE